MNPKKVLLTLTTFFLYSFLLAQNNYGVKGFDPKTFDVTDSLPVTFSELKATYEILNESEKTVGKKGDFSRYKMKFNLTNTGSEAKIMYRNLGFFGHAGAITNNIATFKILNATGARFTNKFTNMDLQPCKLEALVDQRDCATNTIVQTKTLVDIGYWIRPGETITHTFPVIVPLGEKPKVTITYYPEVANQTGNIINVNNGRQVTNNYNYSKIKSWGSNNYLHTQSGSLTCSGIDATWQSADWQLIPVNGSGYFNIKNRTKNGYLASDNFLQLSDNKSNINTQWQLEATNINNVYYIKSAANNAKLIFENNILKISNSYIANDASAQWFIEK